MKNAKISIIVPIYNVEKYLDRCIASICAQTYPNLEIILVDDGSSDNSGKICDSWAEKDDRIIVIHQPNGGISRARNAALEIAGGEYVTFVDSDDYIEPDMYESLIDLLIGSGCDIAMCAYKLADENGKYIQDKFPTIPSGCMTMREMLELQYSNPRYHCTVDVVWNKLFPRRLIENIRFQEGKLHEDSFFLNAYWGKVGKIAVTDKEYYNYRQRKTSIMGESFSARRRVHFYALRERTELCEKLGYGDSCIRSNAVRCVNEGIGFWAVIRCQKLLPKEEERAFYKDVALSCKKYKRIGNWKQRLLWYVFLLIPRCILAGYRIKKCFNKRVKRRRNKWRRKKSV